MLKKNIPIYIYIFSMFNIYRIIPYFLRFVMLIGTL